MGALAEGVIRSADRQLGDCSPPSGLDSKVQEGVNKLVELFSKLNPSAKEFVPSCYSPVGAGNGLGALNVGALSADAPAFVVASDYIYGQKDSRSDDSANSFGRRRNNHNQGRRRSNARVSRAQREESIRRTVYASDIDQHVTEEQLAALFANCGHVVDCRVCGDPHSVLRFAFVEFADERSARAALNLSGTILGYYPVKVLPSKTAILPVNPTFLPQSEDEREMCIRTIYCTNIDMKVSQEDVRLFFETLCGEVSRVRLLGDRTHSTRIAFVEFVMAHSAIFALNCSGRILGTLPIRVSPSKTPVRPRFPRSAMH